MTTLPLNVASLLAELDDPASEPFSRLSDGTVIGHVHLKVAAMRDTIAFYRDVVGFALTAQLGGQAAFLSAGGYHHHLGANTWESEGASPPPPGAAALRRATIVLADRRELEQVTRRLERGGHEWRRNGDSVAVSDPSGNPLVLAHA
jgi:catechol 2,3-dioxygenase